MIINHNIPSLKTTMSHSKTNAAIANVLEKLASGKKINKAADNAAGLAISEQMAAQIRGLEQAARNSQDGISLTKVAQGGLQTINNIVHRIRELCVQAANDTLTSEIVIIPCPNDDGAIDEVLTGDRAKIQEEIDQLLASINQIAGSTEFNTIPLLKFDDSFNVQGRELEMVIGPNGRIDMIAADGNRLNFGNGESSSPAIVIRDSSGLDTVLRLWSEPGFTTYPNPGEAVTTYANFNGITGLDVTQTVRILGPGSSMYEVLYTVTNNSTLNPCPEIGFLFDIDTQLGTGAGSDTAPFRIDGVVDRTRRQFTGNDIPSNFTVFNENFPDIQSMGIIREGDLDFPVLRTPDIVSFRNWLGYYTANESWDWTPPDPPATYGDSAYSLRWDPVKVHIGQSTSVNTFYGTVSAVEGLYIHLGANTDEEILLKRRAVTAQRLHLDGIDVSSAQTANEAIAAADSAMAILAEEQTKYGTYENRLEYAYAHINVYAQSFQKAHSLLVDGNMAELASELAKFQVLEQSITANLATANKITETVLTLLK
jgi:flagellin